MMEGNKMSFKVFLQVALFNFIYNPSILSDNPPFLNPSELDSQQGKPVKKKQETAPPQEKSAKSTCNICKKEFSKPRFYFKHMRQASCRADGYFCHFCPKHFFNRIDFTNHEAKHKNQLAKEQQGWGLKHVENVHACDVYEEQFKKGEMLTIDQVFKHMQTQVKTLIEQSLSKNKVIKFGTVVTGRFEVPHEDNDLDNSETLPSEPTSRVMQMPMRAEYKLLLIGDKLRISRSIRQCRKETHNRIEDLQLVGSGWSLVDIVSFRLELGRCSLIGSCSNFTYGKRKGHRYIIDVPIENDRCFLSAVSQHFLHGNTAGPALEHWISKNLVTDGVSFPFDMLKTKQFELKNKHLKCNINIYLLEGNSCYPIYRSKLKNKNTINILMTAYSSGNGKNQETFYHYSYIKNLDRFLNLFLTHLNEKRRYGSVNCTNCLSNFASAAALQKHEELCLKNEHQKVSVISEGYKEFDAQQKQFGIPFIGIADFESALVPIDRKTNLSCQNCQEGGNIRECSHATFEQNEQIPICYSLVFVDRDRNVVFQRCETAPNVVPLFFKALQDAKKLLIEKMQQHKVNAFWRPDEEARYMRATKCHVCHQGFSNKPEDRGKYKKVRDHDHLTGKPIGASHWICNTQRKVKKKLVVYCHNLVGYDSHFLFKYYSNEYITGTSKLFAIPNNTQKFKTFEMCDVTFVDSFAFLDASLGEMVEDLKAENCPFKIIRNSGIYKTSQQGKILMQSKGIYPYEYISSYQKLLEKELPPRECFYSKLKDSSVTESEYLLTLQFLL